MKNYYIDYIIVKNNFGTITNAYYQLARKADDLILAAYEDIDMIFAECFKRGINSKDVVIL